MSRYRIQLVETTDTGPDTAEEDDLREFVAFARPVGTSLHRVATALADAMADATTGRLLKEGGLSLFPPETQQEVRRIMATPTITEDTPPKSRPWDGNEATL